MEVPFYSKEMYLSSQRSWKREAILKSWVVEVDASPAVTPPPPPGISTNDIIIVVNVKFIL